jgi:hypothetical protein
VHVLLFAPGPETATRVPVLACADALRDGAEVDIVPLDSDADLDAALLRAESAGARIVVAGGDGQLRAVLRRMVRRVLPRGGDRPPDLPDDRTVRDLPPVGVLPLDPAAGAGAIPDLAAGLTLPRRPADVAAAVLGGASRRVDLLRNDGGSVTIHGAVLGATDEAGRPLGWQARIDVDDKVLTDGSEPLLGCAIANGGGYAAVGGLPLVVCPDPTDGVLDVGVALPVGRQGRIEVRRARGRAVSVALVSDDLPYTDDGVDGTLTRKRTWWMERAAWAVYTS